MVRILWVEDQSHWIDRFRSILETTNFDEQRDSTEEHRNLIDTFKFASAACQHVALSSEAQKPDIAILDAHMGGDAAAGFTVSRALLKKWPDIPIIYLSEHSGTETEQTALEELYAQDFIAKHQQNIENVLCWRIKAIIRKTNSNVLNQDILSSGSLKIDMTSWDIYWQNRKLMNPNNPKRALAPMPRKILFHLVKSSPRAVATGQLADMLDADPDKFSYANYRQHIKTLRSSFDQAEGGHGAFLTRCKNGNGIVTFGDLRAYCWKADEV